MKECFRDIARAVKAADMNSDHIRLGVDPDAEQFYVTASGDTDEVRLELEPADLIDFGVGEADSLFSLDYLKNMNKAISTTAEVTMELGENFPFSWTIQSLTAPATSRRC